jgi:hypothetical protein
MAKISRPAARHRRNHRQAMRHRVASLCDFEIFGGRRVNKPIGRNLPECRFSPHVATLDPAASNLLGSAGHTENPSR